MTLIFWNIKGRNLSGEISALVSDTDATILVLAENRIPDATLLRTLNPGGKALWALVPSGPGAKTTMFVKGNSSFVHRLRDLPRISIFEIRFPTKAPFFLATVHLVSLRAATPVDQADEAVDAAGEIRAVEQQAGHTRTIVIGDFNMNPYSRGMTSVRAFNAVATREIALQNERVKNNTAYPYFFNPMWSLFCDGEATAPGTYFYSPPGHESIHWHIMDQVLLRPRMLQHLAPDGARIIRSAGGTLFHNQTGRPASSDHFPIAATFHY